MSRKFPSRFIRLSALAMALALLVVGFVSDGILRHIVQTLPLWLIVVFGARPAIKWFAIPSFTIWLLVMIVIWLYLTGIARLFSGHFSQIEIAMTVIVGLAAVIGVTAAWRSSGRSTVLAATAILAGSALLQIGLLAISFQPLIADDTAFIAWVHSMLLPHP